MAKGYMAASSVSGGLSKRTRQTLILCVILTIAAFFAPFGNTLGYPLILISTFVHEMGHGIMALIMGGSFASFQLFSDGSGVANTYGIYDSVDKAFVAAGGLLGPAVFAALCFMAARKQAIARLFLSAAGAAMIMAEFLYIRNTFGFVFVGVLAALFLWLAQQSRAWLAQASLVFLGIQLSLSVFSRSDYLFTETAMTAQGIMPSDVAVIAQALSMPYWLWGAFCGVFSAIILLFGLWSYVRK